jgi:hypothetical protein
VKVVRSTAFTWAAGAALAAAMSAAFAATRIDELVVRPNPAVFVDGAPPQVEITVTVARGQFDRQPCDVIIETGDGAAASKLGFGLGEERTKSLRYTYRKPGSYQLKALAGSGCTGTRSVGMRVLAAPEAAASLPAGESARANAPAEPAASVNAPAASVNGPAPAGPGCPAGWWLVPESVQGPSYNCRPNLPARPLTCAGGTRYFSEGGVIGCR